VVAANQLRGDVLSTGPSASSQRVTGVYDIVERRRSPWPPLPNTVATRVLGTKERRHQPGIRPPGVRTRVGIVEAMVENSVRLAWLRLMRLPAYQAGRVQKHTRCRAPPDPDQAAIRSGGGRSPTTTSREDRVDHDDRTDCFMTHSCADLPSSPPLPRRPCGVCVFGEHDAIRDSPSDLPCRRERFQMASRRHLAIVSDEHVPP